MRKGVREGEGERDKERGVMLTRLEDCPPKFDIFKFMGT
jgi:hypothetical protein